MNRIIQLTSFVIFTLLLFSFIANKGPKPLKICAKAPMSDLKMKNIDGTELSLNDAKLKNGIIVVFSCNTCPFVVGMDEFHGWEKEYNDLNKLAESNDLGFVLVNSNEVNRENVDSVEKMIEKAKSANYTMPYLVDVNSELANAFGAKTTPHVYMFNSEMKLVFMGSIDNSWDPKRSSDEAYLKNAIKEMSSGKINVSESNPRGCSIKRVSTDKNKV